MLTNYFSAASVKGAEYINSYEDTNENYKRLEEEKVANY